MLVVLLLILLVKQKKSKDGKKREINQAVINGIAEEIHIRDPSEIISKKDNFKPSNEDATEKKKDSKKGKRLASEEIPTDEKADEESKRRNKDNVNEWDKHKELNLNAAFKF